MCVGHLKYETEFIKGSISKRFNLWRENYSKRFNVRQTICQVPFQSKLAKCPWTIVGANFIMYTKYTKNNSVKVDSIKTSQQILYFVSPLSSKSSLNVDHESTFFTVSLSVPFITMVSDKIPFPRQTWKTTTDTLHRQTWQTRLSNLLVSGWPVRLSLYIQPHI